MVSMFGKMGIVTKENGKLVLDMVTDLISLVMETSILGSIIMGNLKALVSTNGAMETLTLACLRKASKKVKANGERK